MICGLILLLADGFFLRLLRLSPLIKKNISNPIQPDMVDEEPLRGCPPSKSFFIKVPGTLGQSHSPK